MRAVSIENLQPGSLLGKSIHDAAGRPLLKRGTELTAKSIGALARLGYQYIYIIDELSDGIESPELISAQLRAEAGNVVKDAFEAFKVAGESKFAKVGVNIDAIADIAGQIVEAILGNGDVGIQMADLKSYDQYTFQHSVNTAVLGAVLGQSMGFGLPQLKELAIGLLLHDIGNVTVPEAILRKTNELTEAEYKYIYEHPRSGFELLRHCESIAAPAKIIALQHHERINGSGYPKGLKGADLHINSQIGAIVDSYDALTSDRDYRKRFLPHEAVEYLMGAGDTHFTYDLVFHFVSQVAPYPPGTIVELSNGDRGIVYEVDMGISTRPKLKLIHNRNGLAYPKGETLDLARNPTLAIEKVVEL